MRCFLLRACPTAVSALRMNPSAPTSFPLEVQFGTASVELSLPLSTTFGALHKKLRRHWGIAPAAAAAVSSAASRQSRLQDADGNTFQPEELVLEWVGQLPDGIVYLVADDPPTQQQQQTSASPADPRADLSPNAVLRRYAPATASAPPSSNAPPPSLSAVPATGTVAAPLAVRRAASGAQPAAAAQPQQPQPAVANGAAVTTVVRAPRQPSASPARKVTQRGVPQSAARPASAAAASTEIVPASAAARSATKRAAGPKAAGKAVAAVAASSSSSPSVTPRCSSLEAALWRVFSSYSMLGPHGCPDALSSQLFFKLMLDCGVANKKIDRGGSAVARGAVAPGPHAAVAELLRPASPAASSTSTAAPAPPVRLHAPPPPCTPLRRSDIELIYIETLKLQVLPAGGLAAIQSSASSPPATINDILNPPPSTAADVPGAGAAVKMNFELFVHALLSVAMSFFGSPEGALALPARSERLRVCVAVSQLATAPWDSEEHAATLHRLVLEYILPGTRTTVWDDRESPAGRQLLSRDPELEDVVRQFELPLLMLFRRYANVPDLSVRALSETVPFAEGKEDRESKENDFSPRRSPVPSDSASKPPSFLQLVASVRSDAVLSWNQWASFCTDMRFTRMLLTNQDTSRIFVQECYARTIAEQKARRSEIPGRSFGEARGPTGTDGFYLNPQRLSLTLNEFIYAFVRCAIVGLGKMQLAVGPAWMLKAFLSSAQSHVVLQSASAQGEGLQSAHSNAASGTSRGGGSASSSKNLSAILGTRTNTTALATSLFKAVAKLRERYTTMWRADACINYFDAIAVHARLDSMALNDAREKEREMQRQQQQQSSKSGSKPLDPPVRMRPVFAAPTVFKLELPPTSSPQTAAEWSTVVDASFRELCRHIAREHDPHRAVLEISPQAAAAAPNPGTQPKALMSPAAHARSMSSPVAKRNPSASPTGRSGQAAAAAPSVAAASPVAAAAAKSPYEHLLLFPRRSATALAALAAPAPKLETQAEKQARLSHAAQIKAAKQARRANRKSMQALLQLEEHPPPVPTKTPSKEVLEKADKLFHAYQRSITHPEEVAAAVNPASSSSASASPPLDSALIPVPTSARKAASTPRKLPAPAPSPRRPQLEGRLIAQRVDQFETPLAAAANAATHQPKSKSAGGSGPLLRIEAPPLSLSRTGSPRSKSVTPRPRSPHTSRPHSPAQTPSARAAEARVAARADARARAASITLSSPPLSSRRASKSQPAHAEEKKEPEVEAPHVDSDEEVLEAITVSAQGTARGRPKSPMRARMPVESSRSQARLNDTTNNFADDDEDAVAAAAADGDLNLSLDDDHDASLWDSPAAVVASVAANKFTPRDEPAAVSTTKSAVATSRKEHTAGTTTQQTTKPQLAPSTPSPATPSPRTPAAAASAPVVAPSSARGAPSASLPASAIAAAASSPPSSGGVRLRNLQVSPIIGAKADPVQHASFASEATALDSDTSFAQVQDEDQQYAPEHEHEHEADEALEADLFGGDHPEEEEQIVSSAADDDFVPDSGGDEEDHEANERFLRGEVSACTSRKDAPPSKSGSHRSIGLVEAFEPELEQEDQEADEEEQKDSFPVAPASSSSAVPAAGVAAAAGAKKLTPMQEAAQKRAQEVAAKQAYDATIARQNAALAASTKAAAESAAIASAQSASQKLVEDSLALHRALTEQVQRGAVMTKLTPGVFSTKAQKKFVRVSSHGDRSDRGDNGLRASGTHSPGVQNRGGLSEL